MLPEIQAVVRRASQAFSVARPVYSSLFPYTSIRREAGFQC